jgi:hypothetical protein
VRPWLMITLAAGAFLAPAETGHAFEGPWCLRSERGGGNVIDDCYYASFAACDHFRGFYGNTASCIPNYPSQVSYPPRKKRKFQR